MDGFVRGFYKYTKQNVKAFLAYDIKPKAHYSKDDHLKLLLAASLVNGFAEGVSRSLNSTPTGETLLSYIKSQRQTAIQETFDQLVEDNVKALRKQRKFSAKVTIAIDWHDVMYYGNPETPMVLGTQHKKGSNYAFEYLTASVLSDGERIVVAVLPMTSKTEVPRLTAQIVQRVEELGIKIRYITLDGGFFNIDTILFLESAYQYILHMPATQKTKKMELSHGKRLRYTTNDHKRRKDEQISFDVVVAYDENKEYEYLFATNMAYAADALLSMFNKRWGIETTYRMCNQFLIRTTSKDYTVRLFYYLLACVVYNIWVMYNEKERCTVVQMKLCLIGFIVNSVGYRRADT